MAISVVESQFKFLPLQRYLKNHTLTTAVKVKRKLLSSIQGLDKDIIMELERLGIHDNVDFLSVKDEVRDFININDDQYNEFCKALTHIQNKIKLDLNLPEKYAFISFGKHFGNNGLVLLYKNMLFYWSNPSIEGWGLIKYHFDKAMAKLKYPTLLGSLLDHEVIPSWIQMEDLSTYIGGLDPMHGLYKQMERFHFPKNTEIQNTFEMLEWQVLSLEFLLKKSQEN